MELNNLTVLDIVNLIKSKQIKISEIVKHYLDNIEKYKDKNAVLELTYNYGVKEYDKGNAYAQVCFLSLFPANELPVNFNLPQRQQRCLFPTKKLK